MKNKQAGTRSNKKRLKLKTVYARAAPEKFSTF